MQNMKNLLIDILKDTKKYYSDGQLFKNKLTEDALKHDNDLLKMLLADEKIKRHFFDTVDDVLIFDKDKFINFANDKEFLPDSYTAFRNKIGLLDDRGRYFSENRDVVLAWPYKDCILEGGQDTEDQKRNEIFYNEILAPDEIDRLVDPKALTNFKKYTADGIEENPNISMEDNYIIKGNNLLALHSLKQKYRGQVKLIYIDPPYNTGNDGFNYNDRFNHSTWLTFMKNRLEIAKELLRDDGVIFVQCDDNEQAYLKVLMDDIFANNYLNTITIKAKASSGASGGGEDKKLKKNTEYIHIYYNCAFSSFKDIFIEERLDKYMRNLDGEEKSFAYKSVLLNSGNKEYVRSIKDGRGEEIKLYKHSNYVIKSIKKLSKEEDIGEYEAYRKYIDHVFTTENAQTSIRDRVLNAVGNDKTLYTAEYVPVSGRNKGVLTNVMFIGKTKRLVSFLMNTCVIKRRELFKQLKMGTLWDDISWSSVYNEGKVRLKKGKKPEKLLQRILEMSTCKGDLVLDFFLGSGTTAAVAHKMNRKYIGIEQLDYGKNSAVERLKNVIGSKKDSLVNEYKEYDKSGISKDVNWSGGGSFVYCELMEWNQAYIDKIQSAKDGKELFELYKSMKNEAFFRYNLQDNEMDMMEFKKLKLDAQKKILIELLDKNHLYVNLSEIEDKRHKVDKDTIRMNEKFYGSLR